MWDQLANVYRFGIKELWSLWRDRAMLVLIVFSFTGTIYARATAVPDVLHNAPVAVVDEDGSPLAARIASAFHPPYFRNAIRVSGQQAERGLDDGSYTFVVDIPPNFQRDVLDGRVPAVQLNVDATQMQQAFAGNVAIQTLIVTEANEFVQRYRSVFSPPVDLVLRVRFNPTLTESWFNSVMELVNQVTILSIILTGAALIREREHGTVEHLLVMPVTLLHLFAMTSMAIFMATLVRNMPQFGLLSILTLLPMIVLSGGVTPRESMPRFVQHMMEVAPTTHYVEIAQAILFRGAGLDVVWVRFLVLFAIGTVLFTLALKRFRKTIAQMA
jgi:ABC-2 type transport system permease protein